MHDLNKVLFYKTSFDVQLVAGDDLLWPIIFEIKNWMTSKWNDSVCCGDASCDGSQYDGALSDAAPVLTADNQEWSALKRKGQIGSTDDDASVVIESATFYDGVFGNKWACAISETIKVEGCAFREWRTEIGFTWLEQDRGTLSLILSYSDQPGFLGPLQPTPSETIPGIVLRLSDNNRIRCSVSGRSNFMEPTRLEVGDFVTFWSFVSDKNRNTPVVFVSPVVDDRTATLLVDPHAVSAALGPSAAVFFSESPAFMDEMNACLPRAELRCTNGAVRVYEPKKSLAEHWKHRFFSPAAIEELGGAEALILLLRRALAQDVHFYENTVRLDDVHDLVRRSTFEKRLRQRAEDAQGETDQVRLELDEFLDDHERTLNERDRLGEENKKLRQQLDAAESKALSLQQAFEDSGMAEASVAGLPLYPKSRKDIVNMFLEAYPGRFDLTERAWRSLDNCESSPEVLWNALYYLCTLLYSLWRSGSSVDLERSFDDSASGFEYKRGEGRNSRADKAVMASRYDVYNGREIFAEPHISKGNSRGKSKENSIRIYLALDEPLGMIILSSIGEHLDNHSTRNFH